MITNPITRRAHLTLHQLARLHGVRASYVDMAKRRRLASTESLLAVLRSLGVPIERMRDVPDALRQTRRVLAHRAVEPVQVVWRSRPAILPLQLLDGVALGPLRCEWHLEDGTVRNHETLLRHLLVERSTRVDGKRLVTRQVPVPPGLPVGYHKLVLECGHDRFDMQVFCAPPRCYASSSQRRRWGMFAPLYALHSKRSWGAGDFGDLAEFIAWVRELGGRFVGTLPLLPAFLRQPCEPSPYSPVSRLLWNEFYLDLEMVPELESCHAARRVIRSVGFQERLRELRQAPLVDYAAQMALKRRVLEALSRSFFAKSSSRRRAFEDFVERHPHVAQYARFRAVQEECGKSWTHWPARMRAGGLRDADCSPAVRQYHLYAQWLAHEQMTQLADRARQHGVDLYLDMPLGTHRDGYDCWRYQTLFALGASGGAPPDPVFTQGQDWGFAPIHPQRSRDQGHAYIRAYLRHHLQQARMLRFDHVMGLHRLYWVPRGLPASRGAYVTYPAEEFYAMLSIESHLHRAAIIGENLGTVPPEVDRALKRHGVSGMYVVQYELRPPPHPALRRIPPATVAGLNTHDMPPFAAFWQELDLADRHELGLIQRRDLPREHRLRMRLRQALVRFLRRHRKLARGESDLKAVFCALGRYLGASDARWLLVNLEDLWHETASQNTPGTSTERVNWRRKLRFGLEQMRRQSDWRDNLTQWLRT